jgi:hypothetical protein
MMMIRSHVATNERKVVQYAVSDDSKQGTS